MKKYEPIIQVVHMVFGYFIAICMEQGNMSSTEEGCSGFTCTRKKTSEMHFLVKEIALAVKYYGPSGRKRD